MIAVAVSESDSIMYYTDGADWWTYNNNSFVPVFTDDIENWVWSSESFKQTAYDTCGNDTACLVDVYVTGDVAVGESSKATAESSLETNAALSELKTVPLKRSLQNADTPKDFCCPLNDTIVVFSG